METNLIKKEENKTSQYNKTTSDLKDKLYTIQNFQFKNRINYSNRLHTKNMATITKFFSRDRMLLEIPNNIKDNKILKIIQNKNKKEPTVEKEKLINQLILSKKETDKINNELKEYQDFYNQLKESNLTFKVIMERILRINNTDDIEDNDEYKILSNKKTDKKLSAFKRQIIDYEKSIEKQEQILAEAKKGKKTNDFFEINKTLKEKNYELENLITKNKKLQITKHKKEEKINYYFNTIQDLRDEYCKMQEKIKINEKKKTNFKNEIYNLVKEKYQIVKKSSSLVEESISLEMNKEQIKNESEKISEEFEKIKDIKKEKEKDEKDKGNIMNKIDNIKKIIEKNNNKITILNHDNDEMENDIYIMQAENDKLKDLYNTEQKYKSNLKEIHKEKVNKEEIKNKTNSNEIKSENNNILLLTIPENTRKKTEGIILQDIEKLKNELDKKIQENNKKEKELEEIKKKYDSLKNNLEQNNS